MPPIYEIRSLALPIGILNNRTINMHDAAQDRREKVPG